MRISILIHSLLGDRHPSKLARTVVRIKHVGGALCLLGCVSSRSCHQHVLARLGQKRDHRTITETVYRNRGNRVEGQCASNRRSRLNALKLIAGTIIL